MAGGLRPYQFSGRAGHASSSDEVCPTNSEHTPRNVHTSQPAEHESIYTGAVTFFDSASDVRHPRYPEVDLHSSLHSDRDFEDFGYSYAMRYTHELCTPSEGYYTHPHRNGAFTSAFEGIVSDDDDDHDPDLVFEAFPFSMRLAEEDQHSVRSEWDATFRNALPQNLTRSAHPAVLERQDYECDSYEWLGDDAVRGSQDWKRKLEILKAKLSAFIRDDTCSENNLSLKFEIELMLMGEDFHTRQTAHGASQREKSSGGKRRRDDDNVQRVERHNGQLNNDGMDENDEDQEEEEEEEEGKGERDNKRPRNSDNTTNSQPDLICPYYRRDARLHERCVSKELKMVKDIKQHLRRCHTQPFYCPICGTVFQNDKPKYDEHIRRRRCRRQKFTAPDGVTDAHFEKLKHRVKRAHSRADQWYTLWDILFPGYPRPQSVYNKGRVAELLEELEQYWDDQGLRCAEEHISARGGFESFHPSVGVNKDNLAKALYEGAKSMLLSSIRRIIDGEGETGSDNASSPSSAGDTGSDGNSSPANIETTTVEPDCPNMTLATALVKAVDTRPFAEISMEGSFTGDLGQNNLQTTHDHSPMAFVQSEFQEKCTDQQQLP